MEKFYLEKPTLNRKNEIIEYINEYVEYNSGVCGTGGLDKILEGYSFEEALDRCLNMENEEFAKNANRCPGKVFFIDKRK